MIDNFRVAVVMWCMDAVAKAQPATRQEKEDVVSRALEAFDEHMLKLCLTEKENSDD